MKIIKETGGYEIWYDTDGNTGHSARPEKTFHNSLSIKLKSSGLKSARNKNSTFTFGDNKNNPNAVTLYI